MSKTIKTLLTMLLLVLLSLGLQLMTGLYNVALGEGNNPVPEWFLYWLITNMSIGFVLITILIYQVIKDL